MEIINKRYVEECPLSALQPHPRNPREGDIGAISQSIEHNGFYGACIVQESTGRILAGNHRFQAAAANGADSVPVIFVDVDDDTALKILLADNRTNDLASYNKHELAELLTSIQSEHGTLDGTGYDTEALQELLEDLGNEHMSGNATDSEETTNDAKLAGLIYKVIVTCETEHHQTETLDQLESMGLKCQLLIS